MAGSKAGGLKTVKTVKAVKARFGNDHYKKIGAMGGKTSSGPDYQVGGAKASGFAAMSPEQRRELGRMGGVKSRRSGPSKVKLSQMQQYETQYGEPTMQPNPAML